MVSILRHRAKKGGAGASRRTRGGRRKWHERPRPLGLEPLEDRIVLASYCAAFPADVSARLNDLQTTLDAMDVAVPVLGSMSELAKLSKTQFISEAANDVAGLAMENVNDASELQAALAPLFAPNTVSVSSTSSGVLVEVLLSDELLNESSNMITLDTGLSGLPVSIDGGGSIDFTIGYEYLLSFNYDCSGGVGSVLLTGNNLDTKNYELELSAAVSLAGFDAKATVGFMESAITGKDGALTATFAVDGLNTANPTVDLGGAANVDLHVTAGLGSGSDFPTFDTDLVMAWNFDTDAPPTVDLKNIEVSMGSYLNDALQPIVEFLQPVLEPIQPIVDRLNEPVPVLTELSNLIGGPDVTFLDLAVLTGDKIPPGYQHLVGLGELLIQIAEVVDMFDTSGAELVLQLGDVSINDLAGNKDLRLLNAAKEPGDLSIPVLQGDFDFNGFSSSIDLAAIKNMVADPNNGLPAEVRDGLLNVLTKLENGIQFDFPMIDDPVFAAISLMMGNDADLFHFKGQAVINAPAMDGDFSLPIGLEVGLGGAIGIDANVIAGYDTHGIRTYLNTGNPADVLEGFYLDKDTHIQIDGTISAHAGVDTMFFDAGVEGGVYATIGVDMINPPLDTDGDGKVRRTENDFLFNVGGGIHAFLDAYVAIGVEVLGEFIGIREEFNLVDETIWSFGSTPHLPNPFIAVGTLYLAGTPNTVTPIDNDHPNELNVTASNGVLELNVGSAASIRASQAEPNETSEQFTIFSQIDANTNEEVVSVSAFGFTQRFHGVQKIIGDAGTDSDSINVAADVNIPVELHGGAGVDVLVYAGNSDAHLYGDQGDDLLLGGLGNNWLYGGFGDDTLKSSSVNGSPSSTNYFFGGDGIDDLYGGDGFHNILDGGNDDDSLYASDEGDVLLGGFGNDFFDTGAGGDAVVAGPGDDRVAWEVGDGTAYVYGYSVEWNPRIVDRGIDVVGLRGTSADDEFTITDLNNSVGHIVQVMHAGTGTGVNMIHVEQVAIQAAAGEDTITVNDLTMTHIQNVGINLGDMVNPDNVVDHVLVKGTQGPDVETIELVAAGLYLQDLDLGTMGGITSIDNQHYVVQTANIVDEVTLETYAGPDLVTVLSTSGPTWIDTGADDDRVNVVATAAQGPVTDGYSAYFATVDVEAGTGANVMAFVVDAAPQLSTEYVYLTDQNLTADQLIPHGIHFASTGGDFSQGFFLITGAADDYVYIQNTLPGINTGLFTADGADTIVLSSNPHHRGDLSTIEGPILVDAGKGINRLRLDDREANAGNAQVQVIGPQLLGFAGPNDGTPVGYLATGGVYGEVRLDGSNNPAVVESFSIDDPNGALLLLGHRGDETINVQATTFPAEIRGGKGNDTVNIEKQLSLDWIQGPVDVFGGGGTNILNVSDQGSANAAVYSLNATVLARTNASPISYHKVKRLNVNMTEQDDAVVVKAVPHKTLVSFVDFGGNDHLFGPDTNNDWNVVLTDGGTLNDTLTFSAIENLGGGGKKDRFVFTDTSVLSGIISAGNGVDTLDYSSLSYGARVDLPATTATNVGGVVLNLENVFGGHGNDKFVGDASKNRFVGGKGNDILIGGGGNDRLEGGSGNDVLVGDAGKDRLFGGFGRDVLIGGTEKDRLFGGGGDDLLVGGSTAHDTNVLALTDIVNEWSRTDLAYSDRIQNLRNGGGLNGSTLLIATGINANVFDDVAKDKLRGQAGRDWFFARLAAPAFDWLPDFDPDLGEQIDEL